MQADMTLISEIEQALILAGYNGTFDNGEGGYLILSADASYTSDNAGEDTNLDKALKAAFGENYSLQLAYDGWGNNYLYLGLADGGAEAVYNSTYYNVSDQLMGQVKEITDAALSILDVTGSGNNRNDMIAMFAGADEEPGSSEFLSAVAGLYGYVDENGNGDISKVSDAELPNLLVLAIAADVTESEPENVQQATGLIQNFALYNGYAATEQGKAAGFDTAYNTFVTSINNAQNIQDVATAYKTLRNTANNDSAYNTYANGQGKTDVQAFNSMMAGLASSTVNNSELVKDSLASEDFFSTGVGNSLFGTYIDSVESFVGINFADDDSLDGFYNDMSADGVVGIFFTNYGNGIVVNNSVVEEQP